MQRQDSAFRDRPSAAARLLRLNLLQTPVGQVLLAGLILALIFVAWLGVGYLVSPDKYQVMVGMTATHVLFGRAAGMSFGYALGFGHGIVISVNMAIEATLVMIVFPLFVFSWRRLLVIQALQSFMDRIERAAAANHDKIRRYGIPGLFFFVFLPFWMTGPLVGSVIGFFLGLRPWLNITIVLGGTFAAILAWAVILHGLHEHVAVYGPFAPLILVGAIILIVVIGNLLAGRRTGNRNNGR